MQHVEITDDRSAASQRFLDELPAPLRSYDFPKPDVVAQVPFVIIGSTSEIVEELLRRRDRWGFSRYTVRWPDLEPLIPVMRRLDELGELAT